MLPGVEVPPPNTAPPPGVPPGGVKPPLPPNPAKAPIPVAINPGITTPTTASVVLAGPGILPTEPTPAVLTVLL